MGTTVRTELISDDEHRDRLGRRHISEERRERLVAAFRQSGLTRHAFARRESIRYTTFCTWVQKDARTAQSHTAAAVRAKRLATPLAFAEVALSAVPARGLEVRLPDGTVLSGESIESLAALARALRA